ncbi:hypothetical protein IQ07DRAFT_643717 [Pyrenochaeta sp. DS3sAY3a]|nr:hypothetical protein IQ07DRAFT_643717 [Pyrenochaeta sp. DS3sAY3a]
MEPEPQRRSSESSRPSLRPLLPAAAVRVDVAKAEKKRLRVSLACAACRTRKTKCDGDRPMCGECHTRGSDCLYTETESTQQRRKHADLEILYYLLQTLPDAEARSLYGRLRAGVDLRDLVEQVQHGSVLVQMASAATTTATATAMSSFDSSNGSSSSEESGTPGWGSGCSSVGVERGW